MNDVPSTIFGQWRHSHEEDANGISVYRPATQELPRARGRAGLELRPDGTFVEMGIGRDDRTAPTSGSWNAESDGSIRLTYADASRAARRLAIVESDAGVLKVQVRHD